MTESPAVSTPQAATAVPANPMEMRVETNTAPVEQKPLLMVLKRAAVRRW